MCELTLYLTGKTQVVAIAIAHYCDAVATASRQLSGGKKKVY